MRLPRPLALVMFAFAAITPLIAQPFTALQDGERFRYQIGWGVFANAGEVVIEAHRVTVDAKEFFRVNTYIVSRGVIRGLFRFENRAELLIDAESGRILSAHDVGISGSSKLDSRTEFNYATRQATHRDAIRPERNRDFPIPAGIPMDLISTLIGTRDWKAQRGDRHDALVYFGRDLYPVVIRAEGEEEIKTPLGKFKAMLLVPRMETETPRGVFKQGGEIKVWVSRSAQPQPVRMQLQLNFGTARLTLVEHSVPAK